jgi:hypothetical protein
MRLPRNQRIQVRKRINKAGGGGGGGDGTVLNVRH